MSARFRVRNADRSLLNTSRRNRFPVLQYAVAWRAVAPFTVTVLYERNRDMNCLRCRGLMVSIKLEDSEGSSRCSSAWQCLLCGEVIDAVIAANRKGHPEPRRYEPRLQGHVNRTV